MSPKVKAQALRLVFLGRLSPRPDESESLTRQEDYCRSYANLQGHTITHTIANAELSGRSADRPDLDQALAILEAGEADGIIVAKLDRLCRSVTRGLHVVSWLQQHNKHLVSVSETIDTTTANGRLFLTLLLGLAQWEAETTSERTSAALKSIQASGRHVGRPPYGYSCSKGNLVPVQAEQEVINIAREAFHKNGSHVATAVYLNELGVPTRHGHLWSAKQVKRLFL